jgi:hypothetical protein
MVKNWLEVRFLSESYAHTRKNAFFYTGVLIS